MSEIPVYIPKRNETQVAARSAIVGEPRGDGVLIYYEGNIYGASNVVTLADRAMIAYYRLRERYPTVAQAFLPAEKLLRVGTLDTERGLIIPADENMAFLLAAWLDVDDVAELAGELQVEGVQVEGVRP